MIKGLGTGRWGEGETEWGGGGGDTKEMCACGRSQPYAELSYS